MNLFRKRGLNSVTIAHQQPESYGQYHHDFGYRIIEMSDKKQLLKEVSSNKRIIIGGGGLWGVDVNLNIFLLSLMLFVCSKLLGKQVFLLGVGYYNSTSKLGRISAWLAGKAATHIMARDQETFDNFRRITNKCELGKDIAWSLKDVDLSDYKQDLLRLEDTIRVVGRTYFITLRRFNERIKNDYAQKVADWISVNNDKQVIVSLMEPASVDPENYELIKRWSNDYGNVQAVDYSYNPLALFLFFQKYQKNLRLMAPQFHLILTAHLNGVPFVPIAYDNKVTELIKIINPKIEPIKITKLKPEEIDKYLQPSM